MGYAIIPVNRPSCTLPLLEPLSVMMTPTGLPSRPYMYLLESPNLPTYMNVLISAAVICQPRFTHCTLATTTLGYLYAFLPAV